MCIAGELVEVLSALLTPTIAIAAVGLGILNYRLALRKRKDELFDRRYAFYKEVDKWWRSTGDGAKPDEIPYVEWDDIEPWAHEAGVLFGDDVAKHLRSYTDKQFEGVPWVPDYEFSMPFLRYLKL